MSQQVNTSETDWSIRLWAYDSDGAAVTGLVYNSTGIAVSVVVRAKGRIVSTTALTLVARSSDGVHTDSAFTEVGNGEYVVDLPDSYMATAERTISLTVAATAITGTVIVETLEVGRAAVLDSTVQDQLDAIQEAAEASGGGGDTSSFSGSAATQINAILSTAANAVANAGLQITTEGFPASLRIGDARTADNGRSITLRVYDIDAPTVPLSQIGTLLLADAKLTLAFTRPGEAEPDVEIDCTFDSSGSDYWIVIAWEKAALDDLDPNLKTQYLWGVKAEWGTVGNYTDPVTIADGKVWIRQQIASNH